MRVTEATVFFSVVPSRGDDPEITFGVMAKHARMERLKVNQPLKIERKPRSSIL